MALPMRSTAPDLVITRRPTHSLPAWAQDDRESAMTSRAPSSVPNASAHLPRLPAFSFIAVSLIDEVRQFCHRAHAAECRDPSRPGRRRQSQPVPPRDRQYGAVISRNWVALAMPVSCPQLGGTGYASVLPRAKRPFAIP